MTCTIYKSRHIIQCTYSFACNNSSLTIALANNNFKAVEILILSGAKLDPGGGGNFEDLLMQSILSNQVSE